MSAFGYILLGYAALLSSVSYSQTIDAARMADWSKAGYPGAIPAYAQVRQITAFGGSPDAVVANDAALQNAIASLGGQDGIIQFSSGTFRFNSPITLRSGLVLKGEGAANTRLVFNLSSPANLITVSGTVSTGFISLGSSAYKDASSLQITQPGTLNAGDYIKIYQNDSSLVRDTSARETVGQIIRVDSIKGSVVYFSNALRRNYLLQDSPRVRLISMVSGAGIECLRIKTINPPGVLRANIAFRNAARCWVKGVESDSCSFAHIRISNATNIEISNSFFHDAFSYGDTGEGYGICCDYTAGECLVENNIFRRLRHSMVLQWGANGNVFSYNFSSAPFRSESAPADLSGDIVLHGNYPYLNLFEGNIVQNIFVDGSHGKNGPFNTVFRNRIESYGIVITTGAGDSTNLVANEITGTGLGKGNYLLQGIGNFDYGNNKNNVIVPAGTTNNAVSSLLYSTKPSFWNSDSPWPPIGRPNVLNSATIPARERLAEGVELTYCLPAVSITYRFVGDGNWTEPANWLGNLSPPSVLSAGSEIIIDAVEGGRCILNVPIAINPGVLLTVRPGKSFVVAGNLTLLR